MGCGSSTSKGAVTVPHRQLSDVPEKQQAAKDPEPKPQVDRSSYSRLSQTGDGGKVLPAEEEEPLKVKYEQKPEEEERPLRNRDNFASVVSLRKSSPVGKSTLTLQNKSVVSLRQSQYNVQATQRCASVASLRSQRDLQKAEFIDAQKFLELSYVEAASLRPEGMRHSSIHFSVCQFVVPICDGKILENVAKMLQKRLILMIIKLK